MCVCRCRYATMQKKYLPSWGECHRCRSHYESTDAAPQAPRTLFFIQGKKKTIRKVTRTKENHQEHVNNGHMCACVKTTFCDKHVYAEKGAMFWAGPSTHAHSHAYARTHTNTHKPWRTWTLVVLKHTINTYRCHRDVDGRGTAADRSPIIPLPRRSSQCWTRPFCRWSHQTDCPLGLRGREGKKKDKKKKIMVTWCIYVSEMSAL